MTTPLWSAARTGLPSDPTAVNRSGQINQFLSPHPMQVATKNLQNELWPIFSSPSETTANQFVWKSLLDTDWAQVALGGTGSPGGAQGLQRWLLSIMPVGRGADLVVSIVADDGSGNPGATVTTDYIPRDLINAMASTDGALSGPLMLPQFHTLVPSLNSLVSWQGPSLGAAGQLNGTTVVNGNYMVTIGGSDSSLTSVNKVFTIPWIGNGQLGLPQAATPLPLQMEGLLCTITDDTIIVAGGAQRTSGTLSAASIYAWTASWNGATGEIGAWTQQPNIPQQRFDGSACYDPASSTVYLVGGYNGSSVPQNTIYYSHLANGQLGNWNTTTMPDAYAWVMSAVIDGYLVLAGGSPDGTTVSETTRYAKINSDGSLGPWQTGPLMSTSAAGLIYLPVKHGLLVVGSSVGGGNAIQSFVFDPTTGPGDWHATGQLSTGTFSGQLGLFQTSDTTWDMVLVNQSSYQSMRLDWVPYLSMLASDFNAAPNVTYWVVVHQVGGDTANYVQIGANVRSGANLSPSNAAYRVGSGAWVQQLDTELCFGSQTTSYTDASRVEPLHLKSDTGERLTTLLHATTPDKRLVGLIESTTHNRVNLCTNPSFEGGTSGWAAGGNPTPTIALSTDHAYVGTHSLKITSTGAQSFLPDVFYALTGLTPGEKYTASIYCYVPAGQPALGIYLFGGAFGTDTTLNDQWQRIMLTFTATATVHNIGISQASTAAGQIGYIDAALIEQAATAGPYFEGPIQQVPDLFTTSAVEVLYDSSNTYPVGVATIDQVSPA